MEILGINEEVILEKRKRKAVVQLEYDFSVEFDSDEYYSERDDELLSDLTDSEDEWGAMNQPKNKAKQVVQTPSKLVELEKRLKEDVKLPKHRKKNSINCNINNNFFEVENESISNEQKKKETIDKKVSKIESFVSKNKRTKIKQNYVCISNTFYNDCNEKSVSPINKTMVKEEIEISSNEEVLSYNSDKEDIISLDDKKENFMFIKNENKTLLTCKKQKFDDVNNECKDLQPDSKKIKIDVEKNQEIVTIDDDKLDDDGNLWKVNSKTITSNNSVKEIIKISEQGDSAKSKSTEANLKKFDIISIEDDDDEQIVISDDEDDVQIISITPKPQKLPVKINKSYSLNNNWNKPNNLVSRNRQMVTNNSSNRQIACTSVPKLSPNISIMPANVHVPKGIEVTVVKRPQSTISSHFKSTKRHIPSSNAHKMNNSSVVNVECKVISKPNLNGEVKFYVSLPNGTLHPVSDELMNQYLKEHNNRLPDYWIVPLSVEVAKQYGFN